MTWVKICGITNLEDALTAVEAGTDALGFVFYEKSPRKVEPETARGIVAKLPATVEKIGVFASESCDYVQRTAGRAQVTGIQLRVGSLSAEGESHLRWGSNMSMKQYVAIETAPFFDELDRFEGFAWFAETGDTKISGILLDSGTTERPGGTGLTFDWEKAGPLADAIRQAGFNLIVAGGLTPSNVAEAIHILQPWGVDVSTGVEASPGKKDPDKVRAFIAAVRQEDAKH